jgi:hypothetical protein
MVKYILDIKLQVEKSDSWICSVYTLHHLNSLKELFIYGILDSLCPSQM